MKSMKQLSLAETGFLQTRKAFFLSEMETVVPWLRLDALSTMHNNPYELAAIASTTVVAKIAAKLPARRMLRAC